ncbi:hypothetical protein [Heliorestis convoluta]|uniref:Uncharacterized protein n=1 Tax=Heliorestis convoluta TaxID=356322 RepID=A0A5Q2N0K3_9FIRM|nr:hypothetical protein [Heliorestis convoluta]QGG47319.1 hypothetical protein FTV88_1172 [Heliorestis convoluta]
MMKYNDGFPMDENMRVTICPLCENNDFSTQAHYCKICGTKLLNECEGDPVYDNYGDIVDTVYHSNPGDARFCEICGKPTYFSNSVFLKPWQEVKKEDNNFLADLKLIDKRNKKGASKLKKPSRIINDLPF